MRILVCVKEVPEIEPETVVGLADDQCWIQTDTSMNYVMNRFDEYAVEEALLIKEQFEDVSLDILTVGPVRSAKVVRRALGMGADRGIHLVVDDSGYQSPFVIASWIAEYLKDKAYDLVLTGVMSEDAMQGQVGPMLAEYLSLPCATAVIKEELDLDAGLFLVEREIEGGYRDTLEIRLPCVLTIQSGINRPRYPVLSSMLRAKKAELVTIQADTLGRVHPHQQAVRVAYPEKTRSGLRLSGTAEEKAVELLTILQSRSLIQ